MILLDQPYVSDFLLQTIREHRFPVVVTEAAKEFGVEELPSAIPEGEAVRRALGARHPLIYTVSESSIGWIAKHLADTDLPAQIERFKNKARFRRDTAALFPDFPCREIAAEEIDRWDPRELAMPFVIKPSVGFFSLGVRRVDTAAAWVEARAAIQRDLAQARGLFPPEVLDTSHFLIEPYISGPEYAVDAYYDAHGEPVILSILEHRFASEEDMTDRLYVTSDRIVKDNLSRFGHLLESLGRVFAVHNFALHLELRVDAAGRLWPIEVNPARFGGWCTTADLTYRAFGVNPYACFLEQEPPDWSRALQGKEDRLYGLVALGNTTGIEGRQIESFDYDALLSRFPTPLELRPVDFRRFPIFGFLFVETRGEESPELEWALHSDLREFVTRTEPAHSPPLAPETAE